MFTTRRLVPIPTDVVFARHLILSSVQEQPIDSAVGVEICDTYLIPLADGSGSIGFCPCGDTMFYSLRKWGQTESRSGRN